MRISAALVAGFATFAVAGCSGGTAEPGAAGTTTLKLGFYVAENHPMAANGMIPFAEKVEEASDGSIEIEIYPDAQLADKAESVSALENGIVDLSFVVSATVPEALPLNQAWFLPFGVTGTEAMRAQWTALHEENPLSEELKEKELVPLMMMVNPAYEFSTKGAPLEGIDDLKGLRLRSPSPSTDGLIRATGANPISVPSTELYESLDRGQLEGTIYNFAGWKEMSLNEQLDHSTDGLNVVTSGLSMVAISQSTWDSLTEEQREILYTAGLESSLEAQDAMQKQNDEVRDELVEDGTLEVHEWSKSDVAALQKLMEPIPDEWASSANSNGLPGDEAIDAIREALDTVKANDSGELPDGLGFY